MTLPDRETLARLIKESFEDHQRTERARDGGDVEFDLFLYYDDNRDEATIDCVDMRLVADDVLAALK